MTRVVKEPKHLFDLGGLSGKELARRVFNCIQKTNCMGNAEQTKKNWRKVLDGLKKTVEH